MKKASVEKILKGLLVDVKKDYEEAGTEWSKGYHLGRRQEIELALKLISEIED